MSEADAGVPKELYLEDLEPGQTFRSGTYSVDAAKIRAFAQEFDPQPFHLDEEAARRSPFQGLVASGWHTAAIAMRLLVTSNLRLAGGVIGAGIDELRWVRPVRAGDVLHVAIEILEVRPSRSRADQGLVRIRTTTVNQDGEAVQTVTGRLVVPRKPTST